MNLRPLAVVLSVAALALGFSPSALAAGGNYVFAGGNPAQRAEVREALNASSFNWGIVQQRVTIHLASGVESHAVPGHIWIDTRVLTAGRRAWAIAQHEYAHQVDFLLLDEAARRSLHSRLGGRDWCWKVAGFEHRDYGCERFASTLSWAFWPSKDNVLRPHLRRDEAGAVRPDEFRRLITAQITRIYADKTQNAESHAVPFALGPLPFLIGRLRRRRRRL